MTNTNYLHVDTFFFVNLTQILERKNHITKCFEAGRQSLYSVREFWPHSRTGFQRQLEHKHTLEISSEKHQTLMDMSLAVGFPTSELFA